MGFDSTLDYLLHAAEAGLRGNRPDAAPESRHHVPGRAAPPAAVVALHGHHAGVHVGASVRKRHASLRLAGQGSRSAARRRSTMRAAQRFRSPPEFSSASAKPGSSASSRCWPFATSSCHGHVQEIIVQNFRAKPETKMAQAPEPDLNELLWTIAVARIIFRRFDERAGAAESEPGRAGADRGCGHQRLGRRVTADARFREPRSALAPSGRPGQETAVAGKTCTNG